MDQIPIHLTDRSDWPAWYKRIRLVAQSKNVWGYIDPSGELVAVEPRRPVYGDFQAGAQKYSSLAETSRMDFDHAETMWRWMYDEWRRVKGDIASVGVLIASTVSRYALGLIVDEDEPREMLRRLRGRFDPDY